jgi:hypothetical protein
MGVHFLVSAGLLPRLASIRLPAPIELALPPPAAKPLLVAPSIPGPVDYDPARESKPSVPVPRFDESPAVPVEPETVPRADASPAPGGQAAMQSPAL